jgi:hypothetical protein
MDLQEDGTAGPKGTAPVGGGGVKRGKGRRKIVDTSKMRLGTEPEGVERKTR